MKGFKIVAVLGVALVAIGYAVYLCITLKGQTNEENTKEKEVAPGATEAGQLQTGTSGTETPGEQSNRESN